MKKNKISIVLIMLVLMCIPIMCPLYANGANGTHYEASKASSIPQVDGLSSDECWEKAVWADINSLWLGLKPDALDFSGRYKIVWSKDRLYFLIEIIDDVLSDKHNNPLVDYYKDDTLEIFIDEDGSGGDHKYNYNAIGYHIAMDYNAVDLDRSGTPRLYNDHLIMKRTQNNNTYTWEIELKIYKDNYDESSNQNKSEELNSDKVMGFGVAYCDNDGGEDRESFIGSFDIPGNDKNLAWQNADVFSTIKLIGNKKSEQRYYLGKDYYYVNDKKKIMDTSPVLKYNRTFIPVKYIAESIGASIDWQKADKKVTITKGSKKVELWIGKNQALVDNKSTAIDLANRNICPFILNGRTFLPLRFVGESLGLDVDWNADKQQIIVISD